MLCMDVRLPSLASSQNVLNKQHHATRTALKRMTVQRQYLTTRSTRNGRLAELPNGMEVDFISSDDVSFLYREIFEQSLYDRPPIRLSEGDVVVDVGANIGFFSMYASAQVGRTGKVFAIEPIPAIFQALCSNLQRHVVWADSKGVPVSTCTPINCGISDGSRESAEFWFYTKAAGWSSMYPNHPEVMDAMDVYLDKALSSMSGVDSVTARVGQFAQKYLPQAYEIGWRVVVKSMLNSSLSVNCRLCTVSDVIREHKLSAINLLKIDVERAELDVLRGIDPPDWPKVQQVVLEAHDSNGQLDEIIELMRSKKFDIITVDQDECLLGSQLYNVYCTRTQS